MRERESKGKSLKKTSEISSEWSHYDILEEEEKQTDKVEHRIYMLYNAYY